MNSKRQWHLDEQERIRKQGFRKRNGGQPVKVENIEWGRKKRRIKAKPLSKENLAIGIARTATNGGVKI